MNRIVVSPSAFYSEDEPSASTDWIWLYLIASNEPRQIRHILVFYRGNAAFF